jgi:hypothetical protein
MDILEARSCPSPSVTRSKRRAFAWSIALGLLPSCQRVPLGPTDAQLAVLAAPALSGRGQSQEIPKVNTVWRNVTIGGGGFVTGLIHNPSQRGLLYARTDVGGAYRKDAASRSWVPLLDGFGQPDWNLQGIESLATDPVEPNRVVLAAGTYTSPQVGNGEILRSTDYGKTWQRTPLPFKTGGNEAGRGNGERLVIDPLLHQILYLGTRRDGLWRSRDFGASWSRVTSFPEVPDDSVKQQQPSSEPWRFNYLGQAVGIVFVILDPRGGEVGTPTSRLYAGVSTGATSLFMSEDAGRSWKPVQGQPLGYRPNQAVLSSDGMLYVTYGDEPGPNGMRDGAVWKFDTKKQQWTNITPDKPRPPEHAFGYAAVAVDAQHPATVLVATWNRHHPQDEIFRSTDGGKTWLPLLGQPEWDHSLAPYTQTMHHHWLSDVVIDPFDGNHVLFTTGYGIWATGNAGDVERAEPTRWYFDDRGLEETVPLALISPPVGPHLVSGLGDIDGFCHDDLSVSPPARFDAPGFKNTEWLDFAEQVPTVMARSGTTYGHDRILGAWSEDSGRHWQGFPTEPPAPAQGRHWPGPSTGPIAIAADGGAIVWTTRANPPYLSRDRGKSWRPIEGAPTDLRVIGDRVDAGIFYGYDLSSGVLYVSRNAGVTMQAELSGLPTVAQHRRPGYADLRGVPGKSGEFWVVVAGKLLRFTDSGRAVTTLDAVADATAVGFGKPAPGAAYPAIFAAARIEGICGIFRSDDAGRSWQRIDDDAHQYGSVSRITGDPRIFGRVYLATGGRGIVYGELR